MQQPQFHFKLFEVLAAWLDTISTFSEEVGEDLWEFTKINFSHLKSYVVFLLRTTMLLALAALVSSACYMLYLAIEKVIKWLPS